MKTWILILISAALTLASGCAMSRPLLNTAGAAGGAVLGNQLSKGDPLATAAGAAGGLLLSEGAQYLARKHAANAYTNGYEKGRSDAVKQQYWILVNQQKRHSNEDNVRLYEIPLPEQSIDGVILKPTTKYLRIEE